MIASSEAEWFGLDVAPLLEFVMAAPSSPKARLLGCAYVRGYGSRLDRLEQCRRAVIVAERFADGEATASELSDAGHAVWQDAGSLAEGTPEAHAIITTCDDPYLSARELHRVAADSLNISILSSDHNQAQRDYIRHIENFHAGCSRLIREIFGNPFRLPAIDPAFLSPRVMELARAIYDGREFGLMPILGDALEQAGCADDHILSHCRSREDHFRGCWVVDLLLGKA